MGYYAVTTPASIAARFKWFHVVDLWLMRGFLPSASGARLLKETFVYIEA